MTLENFIINTYCFVDDYFKEAKFTKLRKRGPAPSLSDPEVVTMEIVGEYLGFGDDKGIWKYFKSHWLSFFPKIGCRTKFSKQCANLGAIKQKIQVFISANLAKDHDLYLCDGFPIPLCHIKRYKRSKSEMRCHGAVGYCAAKDEFYFGFKGHLLVTKHGSLLK